MLVVRPRDRGTTQGQPITVPGPITITSSRNGLSILDGSGAAPRLGMRRGCGDPRVGPDRTASITIDSVVLYPGFAVVLGKWDANATKMDVVVDMPVEVYVPGALTHASGEDWPRQSYECQAVVARTYALHERERRRRAGRDWDVEDTTADQVFGGSTKPRAPQEATQETRGMIITCAVSSSARTTAARAASGLGRGLRGPRRRTLSSTRPNRSKASLASTTARSRLCHRWEVTRTDDDISQRLLRVTAHVRDGHCEGRTHPPG